MANNKSIYQTLLGLEYETMAPSLQRLHQNTSQISYQGRCDVIAGVHPLAKLLRKMVALPKAGQDLPIQVDFVAENGIEKWSRHFDKHIFVSTQWQDGQYLYEKVVFLTFVFKVRINNGQLSLGLEKIRCGQLPLTWCGLHITAKEWEEDGLFHFNVTVKFPLVGEIITYQGHLLVTPSALLRHKK